MAAVDFDATTTPQDVFAALSFTVGVSYTGQNVDAKATLFVREDIAVPLVTARAFRVESGGYFTLKSVATADQAFLWTDDADGCAVIFTEAVD